MESRLRKSAPGWLFLPLMAAGCADGSLIVLGEREPPAYRFGEPELVAELSDATRSDNPSLTRDMLEIHFTTDRAGASIDIWRAQRSERAEPFGPPAPATELNTSSTETSPIVSADGLTLWFASDRAGGLGDLDVWSATRASRSAAWSAARHVPELSSSGKDIPRPPGDRERVMPLGTDRDTRGFYQIYFATRSRPGSEFGAPQPVVELSKPSASTVDGFLTDDGTTLLYVRGPALGPADLFLAARRSTAEPFGYDVALRELNSPQDERDPWLSADGSELYFASDRSGRYQIYQARVRREPSSADAGDAAP
jgi:WD40-like Beta Propeller Repeat